MKLEMTAMNKSVVSFASDETEITKVKDSYNREINDYDYKDKPVPLVYVTMRRSHWEAIGKPPVIHVDVNDRCTI